MTMRRSLASLALWQDEGYRAKVSAAQKEAAWRPDVRAKREARWARHAAERGAGRALQLPRIDGDATAPSIPSSVRIPVRFASQSDSPARARVADEAPVHRRKASKHPSVRRRGKGIGPTISAYKNTNRGLAELEAGPCACWYCKRLAVALDVDARIVGDARADPLPVKRAVRLVAALVDVAHGIDTPADVVIDIEDEIRAGLLPAWQ